MAIDIKITGMGATLHNLKKLEQKQWEKAASLALKEASKVLKKAIVENSSLKDHSLASLRSLDHPYAKRHGSILIHQSKNYVIHSQSGAMRTKVTYRKVGSGKNIRYRIGFNYGAIPYAKYVIQGTNVMLPRNTVYMTSQEREVRRDMMKAVIQTLGPHLRTGAGVRFA